MKTEMNEKNLPSNNIYFQKYKVDVEAMRIRRLFRLPIKLKMLKRLSFWLTEYNGFIHYNCLMSSFLSLSLRIAPEPILLEKNSFQQVGATYCY